MKFNALIILILTIILFTSCENGASYKGIIKDANTNEPLDSVKILVIMNEIIQEDYGNSVSDSLTIQEREKIIKQNGGRRDGWTFFQDNAGRLIRYEPYLTDSMGNFSVVVFESCIFGCPEYKIRFQKTGYKPFEIIGNWKSEDNLFIDLKK